MCPCGEARDRSTATVVALVKIIAGDSTAVVEDTAAIIDKVFY